MWAESAQSFENYLGAEIGTEDVERTDKFGRYYKLPKTSDCLEMLPEDILMLDWYHSLGHDSEDCFDKRGFDVIYGNFHGFLFGDFDRRSSRECIRGAEVSSWCPATEEIFARDGITTDAMFSSYILWADDYTNEKYDEVCAALRAMVPLARAVCKGEASDIMLGKAYTPIFASKESESVKTIDLNKASFPSDDLKRALTAFGDKLHGFEVHTGNIIIKNEFSAEKLLFLHSCKNEMKFNPSHYFCDENEWGIASYAVCYEDGTVECANVYYGRQIGCADFSLERFREEAHKVGVEIDAELESGAKSKIPCYYSFKNAWVESLIYNATPIFGEEAVFCFEWKNPHPSKKIVKIRPYSVATNFADKECDQTIYLYAIGAM